MANKATPKTTTAALGLEVIETYKYTRLDGGRGHGGDFSFVEAGREAPSDE